MTGERDTSNEEVAMDQRGGWTLEDEARAGAIGGHAGTHRAEGLASGDTLGGTKDAAHEDIEAAGPALDAEVPVDEGGPADAGRH